MTAPELVKNRVGRIPEASGRLEGDESESQQLQLLLSVTAERASLGIGLSSTPKLEEPSSYIRVAPKSEMILILVLVSVS